MIDAICILHLHFQLLRAKLISAPINFSQNIPHPASRFPRRSFSEGGHPGSPAVALAKADISHCY